MDIVTYILSKKYTDKSLIGGGAIKGKNCTIDSITAIDGGHRVTFGWTLDDGTEETGYMDVMDGADGSCEEIVSVVIDNNNHFIVTYSDGTTHDCGIINVVNERELTKAQYDALSNAEKMNGTTYYVTDEDGDDAPVVDVVVNGQSVVDENGVARIVIASRIQSDWNQDDSTQQDFIKNKIKARNAGTNNNTIVFHEITPGTEFAHVVEGAAQSFVEGTRNSLLNNNGIAASLSHVEGTRNVLYGASDCHAEGYSNQLGDPTNHTYPLDTHIEGSTNAILKGTAQHAEGHSNIITDGYYSHVEGARNTVSGSFSHAEGQSNTVSGGSAHAEGYGNTASGNGSHTEGDNNRSTGPDSHTEGVGNLASASGAHAEGQGGTASGINSHAEGKSCEATGYAAHAEGNETHAVHDDSHAEGAWTWASGQLSHAEGSGTVAAGYAAHSGGDGGAARGRLAFIHGDHLEVLNDGGAAFGKANAERDTTNHPNDYTIFAVGNGTISEGTVTNRANAFELRSDNTGYVGGQQIVTTTSLNTKANAIEGMIAPQFTATQAYAIGDIVTHNDGLYKFKTAHTANDSWNAAEVDQINISDNIGGGGSSVSVQSLQVSGDKLATITVSGVNHDIYSPNSKTFTMAVSRANIESGETYSTIFGKIKKWFSDLKTVAFTGKSSDLNNDAGFITSSGSCNYANTAGSATDSTKVAKTGDSMTGCLTVTGGNNYDEGVRCNTTSNGKFGMLLGGTGTTGTRAGAFWIGGDTNNHLGKLFIANNNSISSDISTGSTYFEALNTNYDILSLHLGGSLEVLGTGTFGFQGVYINNASGGYTGNIRVFESSHGTHLTADRMYFLPDKSGTIAMTSDISSRKFKENIIPLSDEDAKKLLDVEVVNFDYKEGIINEAERYGNKGVIAEQVEDLIPYVVEHEKDQETDEDVLRVDYRKFIPYLIKTVQIQQKEIDELKEKIKQLEN